MPSYTTIYLTQLRRGIVDCFSFDELNLLAVDIGVDPESLEGKTKPIKAQSLISCLKRQGELERLIDLCVEQRPKYSWRELQAKDQGDLLHQSWSNLDSDLQDAMAIAFNQARRDGSKTIKTRYLFAALIRLKPDSLVELINEIPKAGMPMPISTEVSDSRVLLNESVELSGCVNDSLTHLAPQATKDDQLTSAELFVDIAKFGTGNSVAKLRKAGVTPEVVDQLVADSGVNVRRRR